MKKEKNDNSSCKFISDKSYLFESFLIMKKKSFCRGQVHTWQHQFLSRGSLLEPGPRHPKDRRGLCQLYLFKRKFPSDEQSILYSTDFIQTTIGPRVCAIILYLAGSRLVSSWNREKVCFFPVFVWAAFSSHKETGDYDTNLWFRIQTLFTTYIKYHN